MKPDRFDIRIPFDEPLWRPERFRGDDDDISRPWLIQQPQHECDEDNPARRAAIRRRILGIAPPADAVEFRPRLDRAVGDRR